MNIEEKISSLNWQAITEDMHQQGFALVNNLLSDEQCNGLIKDYQKPDTYRKTVVMERYR